MGRNCRHRYGSVCRSGIEPTDVDLALTLQHRVICLADFARISYDAHAGSVQWQRGGGAVTVRGPYDFFSQNDHLKSCDFHKISARHPHDALTCLRTMGLHCFNSVACLNNQVCT